jgi:hypothetical protein
MGRILKGINQIGPNSVATLFYMNGKSLHAGPPLPIYDDLYGDQFRIRWSSQIYTVTVSNICPHFKPTSRLEINCVFYYSTIIKVPSD